MNPKTNSELYAARERRREYNATRWGGLIAAAIIVAVGLMVWDWTQAAVSNPYYRVTLAQGSNDVGYGQGATQEDAWRDCQRLASLTRSLTAAETRKSPVGAVTKATVRVCKGETWTVTVSPDVAPTCPTAPAPRTQACPQGYTGSWQQTAAVATPPACTITWSPTTAPAGACTPIAVEPTGTATLTWNHDGQNLQGFRIVYGSSAAALSQVIQINSPTQRTFRVDGLTPGTKFFAVKAFNASGESAASNVASKVIR